MSRAPDPLASADGGAAVATLPGVAPDPLAHLARRTDAADAGALNNLGVVLARRGRAEAARDAFARALALDPGMTLARRNLAATGAGLTAGDTAAAPGAAADAPADPRVRALRARLRADGTDHEARRELAHLLAALGDGDGARAECDAWAACAPRDAAPWVARAQVERLCGDPETVAGALGEALVRAPRSATLRAQLGEALYRRGDPHAALPLLDEALAAAPDDADAHLVRSFVLGELGRVDEARRARGRAVALNPALGRADANLAVGAAAAVAPAVASPAASAGAAGAARGREPAHAPTDAPPPPTARPAAADAVAGHLTLAEAFRHKGYHDEARRELRRARALGADASTVAPALAELALLCGEPAAARDEAAAWCAAAPHDGRAWLLRAACAQLAGAADEARGAYRRALESGVATLGTDVVPTAGALRDAAALHRWAHAGLALLALAAGEAPRALAHARAAGADDARALDPAHRLVHAAALADAGRPREALEAARAIAAAHPRDTDAWTLLGALLAAAGEPAAARVAYARALDGAPDDAAARYGLAFAHAALGEHDAARRETERALAHAPTVPGRRLRLAVPLADGTVHAVAIDAGTVRVDAEPVDGFTLDDGALDALLDGLDAASADAPGAAAGHAPPDDLSREADGDLARPSDPWALADELLAQGAWERAIAAATRAIARGGARAAGLARIADAWAARGVHGEALERYAEARTLDPSCRHAALGEARTLRALARRTAARDAAARCVAAWPNDPEALALRAWATADEPEADEAELRAARAMLDDAERALDAASHERRDGRVTARLATADAWRALGEPSRAATLLGAAAAGAPDDARLALRHAAALAEAGKRDAAIDVLRALHARVPSLSDVPLALAGRLAVPAATDAERREAVALLAAVAARDPWHADAIAALGAVLADAGRHADAAVAAARALRLDPDHALAHAVAADACAARGDVEGARAGWRRALALEPAGEAARRARAGLRAHEGRA